MPKRRLVRLSEIATQKISYLWSDRIPLGALTLLDGDPGTGKSTLIYDLIARVTTGRAMPGDTETLPPAGVVLLQAEENLAATVKPNLTAAKADLNRIAVFDKQRFAAEPLVLPDDLPLVEKTVQEFAAKLIVFDPVGAFLPHGSQNEANLRRALEPVVALAERQNAAVVVVRHLTKTTSGNSLYRGLGTIGLIALARSALLVGDDQASNDPFHHVLALNKSNLSQAPSLSYRTARHADGSIIVDWMGESRITARELAARTTSSPERSALTEAKYVLYSILAEGPVEATKVITAAKKAGVAVRTLKRAKSEMKVISRRVGMGPKAKWYWILPDDPELLSSFRNRDINELLDRLCFGDSGLIAGDPERDPRPDDSNDGHWFGLPY